MVGRDSAQAQGVERAPPVRGPTAGRQPAVQHRGVDPPQLGVGDPGRLAQLSQGGAAFTAHDSQAGAYYDKQRARGLGHYAALRQVSNRLVGVLHSCLKTDTPYDEAIAWSHQGADTPVVEHQSGSSVAA